MSGHNGVVLAQMILPGFQPPLNGVRLASAIIGATSLAQLENVLAGAELYLSEEVLEGIAIIHRVMPAPL